MDMKLLSVRASLLFTYRRRLISANSGTCFPFGAMTSLVNPLVKALYILTCSRQIIQRLRDKPVHALRQ